MITSISNPHIREAIAVREKRHKYGHKAFLIEGPHLLEMALLSDTEIKKVFFTEDFLSGKEDNTLLRRISGRTSSMYKISQHLIRRITDTETPQGIAAIVSYKMTEPDRIRLKNIPTVVVVDNVQDPGNLGSIIRTADAAGADAVIALPGTCDPFMPKSIRATAGSIFNLPILTMNIDHLVIWLKEKNIKIMATTIDASISIFNTVLACPVAIVFGNEAHGVSKRIKDSADLLVKIPIYGKAESLNVAASAAICIYEAVRQKMVAEK